MRPAATLRRRDQRGVTLIEMLVVVAVTGLIAVPVGSWVVSTLRNQEQATNMLVKAVGTGRLAAAFSKDVAAAAEVSVGGSASDCDGGQGAGTPVLSLLSTSTGTKISYTEAPTASGSGAASIWRRVCNEAGGVSSAMELLERIVPDRSSASCLGGGGPGSEDCNDELAPRPRVRMTVRACPSRSTQVSRCDPASSGTEDVVLNAVRRVTPGYDEFSGSGPIAQIQASPRVGYLTTDFTLDASASRGIDAPGVTVAWEFPTASGGTTSTAQQVTKRFAAAGEHEVRLTVTDAEGRSNTAVTRVRVINRFPTAKAVYESGTFTSDSVHPDGLALSCLWNFGEGIEVHAPQCDPVPSPWAADAVGRRRAVLVVTDSEGNSDTDTVIVDLGTPPSGPITITPTPVEVAGKLPTVGSVGGGLEPLEVRFSSEDADPGSNWRVTRRGTTEVIATGTGAEFTHTFGPLGHGEYEVARIDEAGGVRGEPVAFRVNAAPIAAFQVNPAGAGGATTFVGDGPGGSSDPDGTVLSYRWELGWPGWTAAGPSPSFVYANPGTYVVKLTVQDEDGVETSTERLVRIAGTPPAPAPPQWVGDQVRWDGVPGAEMYRVTILCTVGAPFVDDVGSAARSVTMPAGFCAGGAVTASLQVRADDTWSSPSPGVNR